VAGSSAFDLDAAFDHAHGESLHVTAQLAAQVFAGAHVEYRRVQRALDLAAFDETFAQVRVRVRADVFDRVLFAFEVVDADGDIANHRRQRGIGFDLAALADIGPVAHALLLVFVVLAIW
jgi:hypothetical protein